MEINTVINNAKKYKDIQNMELLGLSVYEKQTPFYNSKVFGVPLKYIVMGIISYHLVRKI